MVFQRGRKDGGKLKITEDQPSHIVWVSEENKLFMTTKFTKGSCIGCNDYDLSI